MNRQLLSDRAKVLIADCAATNAKSNERRDALLQDLSAWQASRIPAYRRLLEARGADAAVPTDVFRHVRLAAHPEDEDVRVFRTSGTTSQRRGAHCFKSLDLYDAAAQSFAKHMLFPDVDHTQLLVLAAHERDAPDSSLSYMLCRFAEWFGAETTWVWKHQRLDMSSFRVVLQSYARQSEPVTLLGTSFAFVHAEDAWGERRFSLPLGSRIMHTGGFKGKSRQVQPSALRSDLSRRYGVAASHIVGEYGMTELSSQLYENTLRADWLDQQADRAFVAPPWVSVQVVDPETLVPLPDGELGLVRIDDCANLDSVCRIQTSDVGRILQGKLHLQGRAVGATPRGCSLAADEALGT